MLKLKNLIEHIQHGLNGAASNDIDSCNGAFSILTESSLINSYIYFDFVASKTCLIKDELAASMLQQDDDHEKALFENSFKFQQPWVNTSEA